MSFKKIYAGQFNRRVEMFVEQKTDDATGERTLQYVSQGKRWAYRKDTKTTQDEQGQLVGLSMVEYVIRYNAEIMQNGLVYIIRDFDGDFDVVGPPQLVGEGRGRKRYIILKCEKRDAAIVV